MPIRMIYQSSEFADEYEVDVYSFDTLFDASANDMVSVVTGWIIKTKTWVTAPVWYFKPIESKKLLEGT